MRFLKFSLIYSIFLSASLAASLNIGTWNVANNPGSSGSDDANFNTVISAMGAFSILGLNEINTDSALRFRNLVNTQLGLSSYEHAVGATVVGGDQIGFIYDSAQVTLLGSTEISDPSLTRPIYRGLFSPFGTASTADDFYFYSAHLKSGSAGSDITQRGIEADFLRSDIVSLGAANYLVTGDFNLTGASEAAWGNLTAGGTGELIDPAGASGEWRDNAAFLGLHSQDPSAAMDDRFDFVLASPSFLHGNPFEFIPNSYNTIGNDGTHTLNSAITTGTGDVSLLAALSLASDHLPVFANFNIGALATPEPSSGMLLIFAVWIFMMIRRWKEIQPLPEYLGALVTPQKVKEDLGIYGPSGSC